LPSNGPGRNKAQLDAHTEIHPSLQRFLGEALKSYLVEMLRQIILRNYEPHSVDEYVRRQKNESG
jgi:hypothetical protein